MNSLVSANLSCLQQGLVFLESLPETLYARPCEDLFGSSIGSHMRHNLDHYAAFVAGLGSSMIDYDNREREELLETDPSTAISLMNRLMVILEQLGETDLDRPMQICMDDGRDSTRSATSLRRELQFLLSHSIHHYALMVAIARGFGIRRFPENFGIAPSTIHYHADKGA
ncbi:DinB family protein [Puniceicoccales bacterium CK1056]|uniref:DinB family protein n=1 Tax=Oceanipulchritudo coccoides TaxID=2706888 RepID=A0A6B2M2F5_9BACT|nr:DinB family protein [Oceanipulchritudo coccoides]NDV62379.1 DinB family protein [Oceanipulchritudo coccoides]